MEGWGGAGCKQHLGIESILILICELYSLSLSLFDLPQISWIRSRDWTILTNGVRTYTSDARFSVLHQEGSFDWVLRIEHLQERDQGDYECQVSQGHQGASQVVCMEGFANSSEVRKVPLEGKLKCQAMRSMSLALNIWHSSLLLLLINLFLQDQSHVQPKQYVTLL